MYIILNEYISGLFKIKWINIVELDFCVFFNLFIFVLSFEWFNKWFEIKRDLWEIFFLCKLLVYVIIFIDLEEVYLKYNVYWFIILKYLICIILFYIYYVLYLGYCVCFSEVDKWIINDLCLDCIKFYFFCLLRFLFNEFYMCMYCSFV